MLEARIKALKTNSCLEKKQEKSKQYMYVLILKKFKKKKIGILILNLIRDFFKKMEKNHNF